MHGSQELNLNQKLKIVTKIKKKTLRIMTKVHKNQIWSHILKHQKQLFIPKEMAKVKGQ